MKKNIIVFLFLAVCFIINAVDKPIIKTGIRSYGYFKELYEYDDSNSCIYPNTARDYLFFSYEEKFFDFFRIKYKFGFDYSNYNKYSSYMDNLFKYNIDNSLYLYFHLFKYNYITLITKPVIYCKNGEKYVKIMNKIEYKLNFKYFSFKTYYSHMYSIKDDELFYHNFFAAFYWSIPKCSFMKYKTAFTVYIQHRVNDNNDNDLKKISNLKSANFSFEVAFNFNKIDFENIFEENNNEDEFFTD